MKWLKDTLDILKSQPEQWLYYTDFKLHHSSGEPQTSPRFGVLFRFLSFCYHSFRKVKTLRHNKDAFPAVRTDIIFFAQTKNQAEALKPTIREFERSLFKVFPIAFYSSKFHDDVFFQLKVDFVSFLRAVILNLFRLPGLVHNLTHMEGVDGKKAVYQKYSSYSESHLYLAFFYSYLVRIRPNIVVVSNDHSLEHRCLIAVSKKLGITTAYLQHASVSEKFPALNFDLAFLDGEVALNIYRKCTENAPMNPIKGQLKKSVILSGQKKDMLSDKGSKREGVGVAINTLDSVERVIEIIRLLTSSEFEVTLRWHPGQGRASVEKILNEFRDNPKFKFSDPLIETVSLYLAKICVLVAANSSIHLEAVISGAFSVYYEFSDKDIYDYYGYINNGVSSEARSASEVVGIVSDAHAGNLIINNESVRRYSSTFDTPLCGKEGEIVFRCLCAYLEGRDIKDVRVNDVSISNYYYENWL